MFILNLRALTSSFKGLTFSKFPSLLIKNLGNCTCFVSVGFFFSNFIILKKDFYTSGLKLESLFLLFSSPSYSVSPYVTENARLASYNIFSYWRITRRSRKLSLPGLYLASGIQACLTKGYSTLGCVEKFPFLTGYPTVPRPAVFSRAWLS